MLTAAFSAPPAFAADLGVKLTVSNATPNVGDTITFTVTVTNSGSVPTTSASATDKLPAGLSFVSATPSQGTYNSSTGSWTVGVMLGGSSQTLKLQAKVVSPQPQTDEASSGNNSASATETPQQADLAITQTIDHNGPTPGQPVTFTVALRDNGPKSATNVKVTDLVPSGLTLVAATPNRGTYDSSTGVWAIGTVTAGTPGVLKLQTTYAGPGTVTNTSSVTHADQFDPDTTNNSASQTVPVTTTQTTVASSANPSTPGQPVTFTATVQPVPDAGTVRFTIDGSYVGDPVAIDSAGHASLPAISSLAAGSHKVVAIYSGDANFVAGHSPTLIQVVKSPVPPGGTKPTNPTKPTGPSGPSGPQGGQGLVSIRGLTIDPAAFAASSSGPSAQPASNRGAGAEVTYTLSVAGKVRFTIARLLPGRRVAGGRCVKPSKRNQHPRSCTRVVPLRGGFTVSAGSGRNGLKFTGRLSGHKLSPGKYQLIATPTAAGRRGHRVHTTFRIVVKQAPAR